jgi:hypothetical protein
MAKGNGDSSKDGKKKSASDSEGGFSGWKKLLYGASILVALVGSFGLLIFSFMVNDALDRTQSAIVSNIDAVDKDLAGLEAALGSAGVEIGSVNNTLNGLEGSLTPLASGLNKTGASMGAIADSVSLIPGIGSAIQTGPLKDASASLGESAGKLAQAAAGFSAHREGIAALKNAVDGIQGDISDQRSGLAQTRQSIEDVFGLMRIANILFFIVVVCIFGTLAMNSVAGII